MVTDNKNVQDLEPGDADETTVELELLSTSVTAMAAAAATPQGDEHTRSFETQDESATQTVSRLRSRIRSRDEKINQLEYDLEQLRARVQGLEHELKAREEIGDRLHADLRALGAALDESRAREQTQGAEIGALRAELDDGNRDAARLGEELAAEQLARQRQATLDEAGDALAAARAELEETRAAGARRIAQRERQEAERQQRQPAAAGSRPGEAQALRDLRAQLERTERYADELRRQLQAAREDAEAPARRAATLERQLLVTQENCDAQAAALDAGSERIDRLVAEGDELRAALTAAQASAGERGARLRDVTTELEDAQRERQATASRLDAAQQQAREHHNTLQATIGQLRRRIEDLDFEVRGKQGAIDALLNELSRRGPAAGESGVQPAASSGSGDEGDAERATRLFVGTVEGHKLRFPLFKACLTIGRMAANDIQLNSPCISRRHALLENEPDGCRIVDTDSRNGVYVNGRRVAEARLRNGDRVCIGTASFRFEERARR